LTYKAAGGTDVGSQRVVNEDRYFVDADRGVFVVVDGVGGQAAGGRAADAALEVIRGRLSQNTATTPARIREAITLANNDIHRQAQTRAEWHGMACVLTAVVLDGDRAVVGHVGDTRLYRIRGGKIQKLTSDHSPVGEREDAGEISEVDAMRHPRRNEVYRDVGSETHEPGDSDFVDVCETVWDTDAALLLCSDGLTDLVPSDAIQRIVNKFAGNPEHVTRELIKAANDAGGKDNITVIYIEGERFASSIAKTTRGPSRILVRIVFWLLVTAAAAYAWRAAGYPLPSGVTEALGSDPIGVISVRPGQSITAALDTAKPGTTILVEPGEYRERLRLKDGVRLLSRISRGAIIRLPGTATDEDAAIVARDISGSELSGFQIIGDAATPLGTGIVTSGSKVRLVDLEITGAARVAVDLGDGPEVMLLASDIHDNPGGGLTIRKNAVARIGHNIFNANGSSEEATSALVIEPGAKPIFQSNIFRNTEIPTLAVLDAAIRAQLKSSNWFPDARPATTAPGRGRGAGR
jgi:serine/threonine protein phosphatase PrpC